MKDCSNTFWEKGENDPEVDEWVNKNKRNLHDLSDNEFVKLFQWAHVWSGGKNFWDTLRQRVAERFPELVIYPALRETLNAFEDFAGKTEEVSHIRKIETIETIERERKRINDELSKLLSKVETRKKGFDKRIKSIIEGLKKNDPGDSNRAIVQLPGVKNLAITVEKISIDLLSNVVVPVRDAFKEGFIAYDLEAKLRGSLSQNDTRHVVESYDYYSREFMNKNAARDSLKFEIKKGDKSGEKQLERVSQRCQNLYQRMREGLSNRAEFLLQKKSQTMEDAIIKLLRSETDQIAEMAKECLSNYKESRIILPEFETIIQANPIELPSNLFNLPEPKEKSNSKWEKVGTEKYSYEHDTGTCFEEIHTEWSTRDKKDWVSYKVLELPSADGMAEQWTNGISLAKDSLWEELAIWISDAFESTLNQYSDALIHFQKFFKEECDKQIMFIEENGEAEIEKWNEILERLKETRSVYNKLKDKAITKDGV